MTSSSPLVHPAASVVILRECAGGRSEHEIYMIRRSARSAFMPDALVYPGGRVDVGIDGEQLDDAAFLRAAQRECLEEANLELDATALRWFDTWKTPSGEGPRRFIARFYWTVINDQTSQRARVDGVEAIAGAWKTAREFLELWQTEQVDLPPPTLSILQQFGRPNWRDKIEAGATELEVPILPKFSADANAKSIVMPHDPAYGDLPGEGVSCPVRALAYPNRFVRDSTGRRWLIE